MKPSSTRPGFVNQSSLTAIIIACVTLLSPGNAVLWAQQTPPAAQPSATPAPEAPKIPNDQLDSLVAPIALYPDPLLAQTLAASTYPLEIIQLQQWLGKNATLKDKALADSVAKQNWDPSIQAMAALPDVVKQLAENIAWTSDLGNAFLAQQADVMDAVQRMRAKAQTAGNLKPSKEQKVESKQVQGKTVVVIEQADPKVVYVPAYNPTVVYGPPVYPYPPIVYPPYVAGRVLAFGAGVAIGAAWHGGWGWGCGWGHNDVNINVNNNYINNFNKTNINNRIANNSNWQHNSQHRGNAPYGDRGTSNRYGGSARQQPGGGAGNRPGSGAGIANRPGGAGGAANRPAGGGDRISGGGGGRPSTMPSTRPSGGSSNRIGNQSVGGGSRGGGDFGGGGPSVSSRGGGFGGGGGSTVSRASSSRGGASMGGGGFSRGGGGRGGGGRRR